MTFRPKTAKCLNVHIILIKKVSGLCGNNDGSSQSEFLMENNAVAGNVVEFSNSWVIAGDECDTSDVQAPVSDPCNIQSHVSYLLFMVQSLDYFFCV